MLNSKITKRLIFAKKKGYLDGSCFEACALGFHETNCFDILSIKKLTICNPEKSVIKKAIKNNHLTFVDLKGFKIKRTKSFDKTFVNITKSRKESFFNIATAFFLTKINGIIIITGDKELGVDFYLKKINSFVNLNIISKSHGKITIFKKPEFIPKEIKTWKNFGKFQKNNANFITLPGCFSEKEIDDGSRLLSSQFTNKLYGKVADLGAGWGYLSAKALESNKNIKEISLVESNLNALNCSRKNISNFKANFFWVDIEFEDLNLENYDHVIMNPPFHKGKKFVHSLVSIFLKKAKKILAKNGTLWMVYKKELQYEFVINDMFQNFECIYINKGYRIIRAIKRY